MLFRFSSFIFLFLIISLSLVSALGVSPAKLEINFEPNLSTEFEMRIYNLPVPGNLDAEVYVGLGELDEDVKEEFRDVITLEKTIIPFTDQEEIKGLMVYVNLPEGISKQGIHELRIGAVKSLGASGEGISVVAGNEIRVLINVPEKYASDKFARIKRLSILNVFAEDVKKREKSDIEVLVKSDSDVALENVYAEIKVSKGGDLIETLKTNKVSIEPGEQKYLDAVFEAGRLDPGVLILDVKVFYDSKSVDSKGTLKILEEEKVEEARGFPWWIWFLLILLILIIILIIIYLLRRRKEEQAQTIRA